MKKFLLALIILVFTTNCSYALALKKQNDTFVQKEEYQAKSEQANVYYAQNDIKEAKDILLFIPEGERTAQNWLLIGNILQDQGKAGEAEFMYQKAIETDEKFYKAYYNLGTLYMQQDKPNMAVEAFQQVVKLKPDYPYGHYNLACVYIKLEKYQKARIELLDAIELKNTEPDFHYNLAYVYKKLNKEKAANLYIEYYNKLMGNQ